MKLTSSKLGMTESIQVEVSTAAVEEAGEEEEEEGISTGDIRGGSTFPPPLSFTRQLPSSLKSFKQAN